jgi:uncharacterized protein YciI
MFLAAGTVSEVFFSALGGHPFETHRPKRGNFRSNFTRERSLLHKLRLKLSQQENKSDIYRTSLKLSDNKGKAGQFMEGHKEWIERDFDDGVFLLAGSLQPNLGDGIVAHYTSLPDLQSRVKTEPFVAEKVVKVEILEITPSIADARVNL